ncbi:UDP-glycosyltransferase 92A1-like protein [Tanacetum coccineum]
MAESPAQESGHDQFHVSGFPKTCRFEISQLHQFLQAADGKDEWSRFFQTQLSLSLESNGWLCNTVEEIETMGLEVLRNYVKVPVWCVGPLLPIKMLKKNVGSDTGSGLIGQRSGKEPGIRPENCIEWLDAHSQGSVLYISFGSQNTISETQMMELAKGLEESKKPFIWVIRPPIGFDLKGDFRPEWLPLGFEDRIGKQGLMVHNWAPQLEILCHRSTGAFLTHCGWNSVMESLSQGVPLIGWPLAAEQGYNAKMLVEEMGVCVVLTRGVRSRPKKEEVRTVIEAVLDTSKDGKGESMRKKACELGDMIRTSVEIKGGSSPVIISDLFMAWANEVAKDMGVRNYSFTTSGAYALLRQRTRKEPGIRRENCIKWLDLHHEGSGEFRPEWLPLGFKERIGKQGLMVHNWAPQLEILCHRSTGAFLTHCWWNSVMESLSQGVPLIWWPLAAEQGYNAKMLVEEMGVCVVLVRGVHSRIEKEGVRCVIEAVLDKSEYGKVLIPETTFVGVESRVLILETTVWDTLIYPSDTLVIRKQKLE